jgi:hypothetical protein
MDVKPLGTAVRVGAGHPVGDRRVSPGLAGVRALRGPGSRLVAAGKGSPTENGHAVDQGGPSLGAGTAVRGLDTADCHALDGDQPRAAGRVVAGADQVTPIVGGPHAANGEGRA